MVAILVLILFVGYRLGRFFGALRAARQIARKEEELFTAQRGFKNLYEQELATLKQQNAKLEEGVKSSTARTTAKQMSRPPSRPVAVSARQPRRPARAVSARLRPRRKPSTDRWSW